MKTKPVVIAGAVCVVALAIILYTAPADTPPSETHICDPDILAGTPVAIKSEEALAAPLYFGENGYDPHFVARVSATSELNDELVAALVQALETHRNPYVRAASIDALHNICGKDAIPVLVRALDDGHGMVRGTAFDELERYRHQDEIVPVLIQALGSAQHASIRVDIVRWLEELLPHPDVAPALIQALKEDNDWTVRVSAISVLNKPPLDPDLAPVLIRALEGNSNLPVRLLAAQVLAERNPDAVSILTSALENDNPDVRVAAAWALMREIPEATDTISVSILFEMLDVDLSYWYWQAKVVLGWHTRGVVTSEALGGGGLRRDAIETLGQRGRDVVPALIQALDDPQWHRRHGAAEALERIGPEARDAVPVLIQALENDPDDRVRGAAAVALKNIGGSRAIEALLWARGHNGSGRVRHFVRHEVLPSLQHSDLTPALDDLLWEWETEIVTASGLKHMGPEAETLVPLCVQTLEQDEDWRRRHAAAQALGYIGPQARAAIPALARALRQDENECVRGASAFALKSIAPASVGLDLALEALIDAAENDPHPGMRAIAIEVLATIGPEEEVVPILVDAIPDLVRSLEDERWYVREAATRALYHIKARGLMPRSD